MTKSDDHGRDPGAIAIGGPRDLPEVRRFSHEAMATVFEVYAVHDDRAYAAQAAQAAFDLVDRLELDLSRFVPNSDIARINHLQPGESTRVSASTHECLAIARHMFDLTGGAFDVSIGTGLPSLELHEDLVVRATTGGVRLDLGGIGKGYAVDRMAEVLEEWGVKRALVHGGFSSVLALEPPAVGEGWPLTLSDPGPPSQVLAHLLVRQTSVGASGVRKGAHIVDPRTSKPAVGRVAAWVSLVRPAMTASDGSAEPGLRQAAATVTEALTTAFMLLEHDEIDRLCRRSPGLEAWIFEPSNEGHPRHSPLLHFGGSDGR